MQLVWSFSIFFSYFEVTQILKNRIRKKMLCNFEMEFLTVFYVREHAVEIC